MPCANVQKLKSPGLLDERRVCQSWEGMSASAATDSWGSVVVVVGGARSRQLNGGVKFLRRHQLLRTKSVL